MVFFRGTLAAVSESCFQKNKVYHAAMQNTRLSRKIWTRLSMHRNSLPPTAHLCKSCQGLILTDEILRNIPEALLPNGLPALDLVQGFIDLPVKRKDRISDFPAFHATAAEGCHLCKIFCKAIEWDRAKNLDQWCSKIDCGDVNINFRYNCVPELGKQSILPGEWPTMLSTLEAVIQEKDASKDSKPIIIVFEITCDPSRFRQTLGLCLY